MLGPWFDEYDELTHDVVSSNYQTFPLNVQRWFDLIDSHDLVARYVRSWEQAAGFSDWYQAALLTSHGMVGSGQLKWPRDTKARLGLQLALFRAFGSGDIDLADFSLSFFYTEGNLDAQVSNVAGHLFIPFARELRRELQKIDLTNPPPVDEGFIPASDRVVQLDHNSAPYHDLLEALGKLESAIEAINDYPEPAAQDRHVAELSAGKRLLKAGHVRVGAVRAVLGPPLRWVAKQFVGQEIGHFADQIWTWLATLIGS